MAGGTVRPRRGAGKTENAAERASGVYTPDMPVTAIKGIGPKKAESLAGIGINTVGDFLFYYPRAYQDRRKVTPIGEMKNGGTYLVCAEIKLVVPDRRTYRKNQILRLLAADDTGAMEVVFFNAKYMTKTFSVGMKCFFFGTAKNEFGKMSMAHPEYYKEGDAFSQGILPVYPLTAGISQNEMHKYQLEAQKCADGIEEYLPEATLERNRMCGIRYALRNIHFPETPEKIRPAKYRLVFEEFLLLQLAILEAKRNRGDGAGSELNAKKAPVRDYVSGLAFPLTAAQRRVAAEISRDMESPMPMNRLIQGDVGSGKTAIAEIALYKAVKSGFQGVLMAPTELLARQHFSGLKERFEPYGIRVGFLSGSLTAAERKRTYEDIKTGVIDIIVGTHALIQPDIGFHRLGLAVTDEQHRFGVRQRMMLAQKGEGCDVMVMTATPIPRTLAAVLYGDLDVSVIDELPPGRQKIITRAVGEKDRAKVYKFAEDRVKSGGQVYVVAPLIGDSEGVGARSAEALYDEISARFPGLRTELLHGAMDQKRKDAAMLAFAAGDIDILVSTVVIEVGINVPNATVMIIENSERFGLAQMHQLRGRVGRGSVQSYCFLITDSENETAQSRAKTMEESSDGFYIAEKDLELRGPGEIFGMRQHGIPDRCLADMLKYPKVLEDARREAEALLDGGMTPEEAERLRERTAAAFGAAGGAEGIVL